MTWTPLRGRAVVRDAFAGSAVLDLLVRSGAVAELLAPVVSLLAGTVAGGTLAAVTTWAVFGVGFFLVAPVVYPEETGFPRTETGFRLLFAATAVALGVVVGAASTPTEGFVTVGITLAAGYAALGGYLRFARGWRITHPRYPPVRPVEQFAPFESRREEVKRDLQRDGLLGVLGRSLWIGAFGMVLLAPCLLAGVLAVALENTFPLYDFLVLGWVVSKHLGWTVPGTRRDAGTGDPDPDTRLFGQIARSVRNLKGLFLVVFASLGLVISGLTVYVGVSFAANTVLARPVVVAGPSSVGWTAVGIAAWLAASGTYGFVVWYAELRRIPAFLDEWTGRPAPTGDPHPTPPGHVLPAIALAVATVFVAASMDRPAVGRVFGTVWPLGILAVAWGLYRWRNRGWSGVWAEDRTILVGLLAHGLVVPALGGGGAIEALLAGEGSPVAVLASPTLVGFALLAATAWIPDVHRLDDPDHPVLQFVLPGYAVLLAGIAASAGSLVAGAGGTAFETIAAVCLLGGLALVVVRRYGL